MKKVVLAVGLIIALSNCTKDKLAKPLSNQSVPKKSMKSNSTTEKNKEGNSISEVDQDREIMVFDDSDPCQTGQAYCIEAEVDDKKQVADFKTAVDNGNESDFLTSDVIASLSNGNSLYIDYLEAVRDGDKVVDYVFFPSNEKIAFLYANSNPGEDNYEAAQVFNW